MESDELVYDAETFPPGCVCAGCIRPFRDGERYSQRLASVTEGVTLVEVVCLDCAWGALEGTG